jgi:ABC-2 type transport system ATP-binding protein
MITTDQLTKSFRHIVAVDHLTLEVRPGRVTGFLGPNGAGKTTTIRLLLGLDTPSSGTALFDGRSYRMHPHPLRVVGSLLDASAVHGVAPHGRT